MKSKMKTLQDIEEILNQNLKVDRYIPSSLPGSTLWNWLHDIDRNNTCIWLHETRKSGHKICLICGNVDIDALENTNITHIQINDGFLYDDINWETITIVDIPDYNELRHKMSS